MSCCQTPQLTVYDCFDRGRLTAGAQPLATRGQAISLPNRCYARFSLTHDANLLTGLRFQASSCTTLIACCQAITELYQGATLTQAAALDATTLLHQLPGVPAAKQDRALLAVAALRSALNALPRQPPSKQVPNSPLHQPLR